MSNGGARFKRMVVGLPQGLANRAAVEAAVQLAELLRIELLATFIADSTLRALAEFPAVRELRTWGQQWQPLEPARISQDLEQAAIVARWCFAESVKNRTVKTSFEVVAGVEVIASLIRVRRYRRHHRADASGRADHTAIYQLGPRGVRDGCRHPHSPTADRTRDGPYHGRRRGSRGSNHTRRAGDRGGVDGAFGCPNAVRRASFARASDRCEPARRPP